MPPVSKQMAKWYDEITKHKFSATIFITINRKTLHAQDTSPVDIKNIIDTKDNRYVLCSFIIKKTIAHFVTYNRRTVAGATWWRLDDNDSSDPQEINLDTIRGKDEDPQTNAVVLCYVKKMNTVKH